MAKQAMSMDEKKWRAEDDARALKRAQEIQSDSARVKEAHKVIKTELDSLSKIASKMGVSKATSKKSTKKK